MSKDFFKKMFADGETDTVSHKRIVSIVSLIVLVALAFMSACGMSTTTDFIYVFAVLTGGESMLTTIEKTGRKITTTKKAIKEETEESSDETEDDTNE